MEKLERVTYHVALQWIEAVRREADFTGESYAAVVNRAFANIFGQSIPRMILKTSGLYFPQSIGTAHLRRQRVVYC